MSLFQFIYITNVNNNQLSIYLIRQLLKIKYKYFLLFNYYLFIQKKYKISKY